MLVYNKLLSFIMALSVIRGFFAFLLIPIMWSSDFLKSNLAGFWENNFFVKGVPVYNIEACLSGLTYLCGFLFALVVGIILKFKFKWLLSRGPYLDYDIDTKSLRQIQLFCYFVLTIWVALKIYTVFFQFEYFHHNFFEGSYFSLVYQRIITHFFLPNIFFITGAYILSISGSSAKKVIGITMFVLAMLASLNYGSRGLLVLTTLMLASVSLENSRLKTRGVIQVMVPFSIVISLMVFNMAYSNPDVWGKVSGLILRLDVYHLVSHVAFFQEFDVSQGVNAYSREIGVISKIDFNTGVGYPSFLYLSNDSIIITFICGMLPGVLFICFTLIRHPALRAICLWSLLDLTFHWVEMSHTDFLKIITNFLIILCIYLIISYSYRSVLLR